MFAAMNVSVSTKTQPEEFNSLFYWYLINPSVHLKWVRLKMTLLYSVVFTEYLQVICYSWVYIHMNKTQSEQNVQLRRTKAKKISMSGAVGSEREATTP